MKDDDKVLKREFEEFVKREENIKVDDLVLTTADFECSCDRCLNDWS